MGQKVNPIGFRLCIGEDVWNSKWYANPKQYPQYLLTDLKVRQFIKDKLYAAGISRIRIERPAQNAKIKIYAARLGMIVGKKGGEIEVLRKDVSKIMGVPVNIDIEEVRRPELDAQLVAESITQQLEKRVMFRRAMKRAMASVLRAGAEGVKVQISGRVGGAEIARTESYHEGRVPLQTLRADIDYGLAEAKTTYGILGVKVWISRGDILNKREESSQAPASGSDAKPKAKKRPVSKTTKSVKAEQSASEE